MCALEDYHLFHTGPRGILLKVKGRVFGNHPRRTKIKVLSDTELKTKQNYVQELKDKTGKFIRILETKQNQKNTQKS